MDSLNEITKNSSAKQGFFKHVFNFDDESKENMLNIIQYALLALIPIIILNKGMQRFVPEADDEKGNIEVVAEIIMQVVLMFIGLLFIHRIITYIPTYSGAKYDDFSVTNIILAVLIIVLSLQTKLGEKVSILVDRISEIWEGSGSDKKKNKKNQKKNNQPVTQNQVAINQSLNSQTTSLSQLPPPQLISNQASPVYNVPSIGGTQNNSGENQYENFGPMAANEALGGSGFGGANW
jgi:Sec-independent protein translocase protein TatA